LGKGEAIKALGERKKSNSIQTSRKSNFLREAGRPAQEKEIERKKKTTINKKPKPQGRGEGKENRTDQRKGGGGGFYSGLDGVRTLASSKGGYSKINSEFKQRSGN